ncbi:uncharacterized protein LOC142802918 [Rhipicephalus microplus]|uniref:uncharacterized protein LOC142802918 n=1 Tax=Rhipicephalus microplus TaxID=6941 RepID=UPI003F6CE8D7
MGGSGRFLYADTYEKERCGRDISCGKLSVLCLIVVLPAVLCCLFFAILMISTKTKEVTTETADTLPGFQVASVPVPNKPRLISPKPGPRTTPACAGRLPLSPSHYLPQRPSYSPGVCTSSRCRFAAQWIRSKLDPTKNPCKDFYSYVCGTHRGYSTMNQVAINIEQQSVKWLTETKVPRSNQRSWEKAAGLYQACLYFLKSNRSETAELVTWMKSLDLDLSNGTKLSLLNPVDLIVRCSLDLGVSAVFEFELKDKIFYNRKRRVEFSVSVQEKFWMHHRRSFKEHYNLRYYAQLLRWFSPRNEWYHDISTAYAIIDYEYEFYAINQVKDFVFATYIPIGDLYKNTAPYITKEQWVTAFSKYTNNTYTETDSIFVKDNDLQILALSLKSKWLGAKGLNYLVAWNVYTRLVNFTLPYEIGQFLKPSEVCYDHTGKAMRLALLSPYLERASQYQRREALVQAPYWAHNPAGRWFLD